MMRSVRRQPELNTVAQECISGVRTVKAFAREGYEIEKFSRHNRRFYELNMRQAKTAGRPSAGDFLFRENDAACGCDRRRLRW